MKIRIANWVSGNKDHIPAGLYLSHPQTHCFAYLPFDSISDDGIANAPANRKPKSTESQ